MNEQDASGGGNMTVLRDRENMSTKLARIAELAKEDRERQFNSIAHLLTVKALYQVLESLQTGTGS